MNGSARAVGRGLLFISPWLAGFCGLTLGPALLSAWYSLTDTTLLDPPVYTGLSNFRRMWSDSLFWIALRNTLVFAAMNSIGVTAGSLGVAVLLHRAPARVAALARAVIFLPTVVPVVTACACWMWVFNPRFGILNSALTAAGATGGPDWLGDSRFALASLGFMSVWVIGSPLLVAGAALREVPRSLLEAAAIDGLGSGGRLWHVTLPAISPALMFNGLMALIWSLQLFGPPLIMTRGGPEHATLSYSMYVYLCAFSYGDMGYACALAWVQLALTLALSAAVLVVGGRFVRYRTT
ncbi:MAG: sugar ABC transporter permease [Phycisphaerae bacterium]|nr:sugar ABC transporter permease [Phycisphaerae bacterium]